MNSLQSEKEATRLNTTLSFAFHRDKVRIQYTPGQRTYGGLQPNVLTQMESGRAVLYAG